MPIWVAMPMEGILKLLWKRGLLVMEDIDTAVANILKLKFEMGLFENPYVDPSSAYKQVRSESHKQLVHVRLPEKAEFC